MICGCASSTQPTGGRPSLWQCIGRYVMALVAVFCVGIGYLWIAIDPRRQGWHDKVVRHARRAQVVARWPAGIGESTSGWRDRRSTLRSSV